MSVGQTFAGYLSSPVMPGDGRCGFEDAPAGGSSSSSPSPLPIPTSKRNVDREQVMSSIRSLGKLAVGDDRLDNCPSSRTIDYRCEDRI
jgi:hypothetical protein